jgi:hypothetical protein
MFKKLNRIRLRKKEVNKRNKRSLQRRGKRRRKR